MFEKFTKDARESVVGAQAEARALGADRIGTEHVLLGMLRAPDSVAARSLQRLGVAHADVLAAVRALPPGAIDAEALAGVGIDLDAVRAQVEASFGPGALDTPPPQPRRAPALRVAGQEAAGGLAARGGALQAPPDRHRAPAPRGRAAGRQHRLPGTQLARRRAAAAREAVAAVWADVPVG